ncbi:31916_t:CDS:1, partial [Racocetra persica]
TRPGSGKYACLVYWYLCFQTHLNSTTLIVKYRKLDRHARC